VATYKKHCRGCPSFKGRDCSFQTRNSKGKCPCSLCVVKSMCRSYCDKWHSWADSVSPLNHGKNSWLYNQYKRKG